MKHNVTMTSLWLDDAGPNNRKRIVEFFVCKGQLIVLSPVFITLNTLFLSVAVLPVHHTVLAYMVSGALQVCGGALHCVRPATVFHCLLLVFIRF